MGAAGGHKYAPAKINIHPQKTAEHDGRPQPGRCAAAVGATWPRPLPERRRARTGLDRGGRGSPRGRCGPGRLRRPEGRAGHHVKVVGSVRGRH
jgi:hypothetical protein